MTRKREKIKDILTKYQDRSRHVSEVSPNKESDLVYEHQQPPTPTLEVRGEFATRKPSEFFMEYQMTVQTTIENLTTKQASILLMVCNVRAVQEGVDHSLYLVMEFLYTFLLRSKLSPMEYKEEKGKQTLLVCNLILQVIRGTWLSLEERERLPQEVVDQITQTGWLPTKQTFKSWETYYEVRKFFRVRTVPLDTFMNPERNSERYSSYCKGYGEGGSLARVQKTPFSAELDGESGGNDSEIRLSLLEITHYNQILNTIEKWRNQPKEED